MILSVFRSQTKIQQKTCACQYRHEAPPEFPLKRPSQAQFTIFQVQTLLPLIKNARSNRSCAPSSTRQVELRRLAAGTHDVQGGNSRLLVESSIPHCDEERCGAHGDQGPWPARTSLATVAENVTESPGATLDSRVAEASVGPGARTPCRASVRFVQNEVQETNNLSYILCKRPGVSKSCNTFRSRFAAHAPLHHHPRCAI